MIAPTVSVEDISIDDFSQDSLMVSWNLPPKTEWKGIIENFTIKAVPIRSISESTGLSGSVSKRATENITAPKDIEITVTPNANNPDPSLAMEPFEREVVNISNLENDYEYSLTISIDNAAGRGAFSAPINISMPEAGKSTSMLIIIALL